MARRLDSNEKALWGRVIASVKPIHAVRVQPVKPPVLVKAPPAKKPAVTVDLTRPRPAKAMKDGYAPFSPVPKTTLDGTWNRKITKGAIIPDVSVDLHGSGLASAYARLDGALEQAIAQKLRVILLVTGNPRAHDRASGEGRGAIASLVRDWLAASRHAGSIAAVRNAHPRHGGAGALYIILKR
jgi:DNA-nicking Smr family endonuclease